MTHIIDYEDRYEDQFSRLNRDWLEKYGLMESHDLKILEDPRGTILNKGGFIYLAAGPAGEIIGTAALVKGGEHEFELAKMAVAPAFQGRGISKLLMEKCLEKARESGAKKITLYSNSRLEKALKLYARYGFIPVSAAGSPFVTADVKMELQF